MEPSLYVILGSLLGIVGVILVLWGAGLIGRKATNKRICSGIVIFGVGLSMLVINAPEYATPFAVLATLALAFAAFRTIKQSTEHEQRRKVFEDDKENRDRKEHWLDEILQWANDIDIATDKELLHGYFGLGNVEHQDDFKDDMWRRHEVDLITGFELNRLRRRVIYIKAISGGISQELGRQVHEVTSFLNSRDDLLRLREEPEMLTPDEFLKQKGIALECISDQTKSPGNLGVYWRTAVRLHRNMVSLTGAVDKLIDKTSEIKVSLLSTTTAVKLG